MESPVVTLLFLTVESVTEIYSPFQPHCFPLLPAPIGKVRE